MDTPVTPQLPAGIGGTDLGVSFERDGKLWFLFGDTWTKDPADQASVDDDSVAWTDAASVAPGMPALHFVTKASGHFEPLKLAGLNLEGMNVPLDAVPFGAVTYLFFNTGWSGATGRHTHSVLAHAQGTDFAHLVIDHVVKSDRFLNVSTVVVGSTVWIFGSGHYRASPVYLAKVDASALRDRAAWRYWNGASFVAGEGSAVPVVNESSVGELSVRRHEKLGIWLMTYNCATPRGIVLRWSRTPEGPWSDAILIMEAGEAYGRFQHMRVADVGFDDGLAERGREDEWGGEYGPYLVPRWFTEDAPGVHSIVWVLSTWNPYTVHLMKTVLAEPWAPDPPAPRPGAGLPKAALVNGDLGRWDFSGWQSSGSPFGLFAGGDGRPRLTTFLTGDSDTGTLSQDFTIDETTSELVFSIHGGDALVRLVRADGEVVRTTWGRRVNDKETSVKWNLVDLRGEKVRLEVVDHETGPWGFVGSSGFELR